MSTFKGKDLKFIAQDSWDKIQRGWIYECAVPYISERPLSFFQREKDDRNKGSVAKNNGDFKPMTTYEIVLPLKQRKVVVLSNDDICGNKHKYNVVIAPVISILPNEVKEPWYDQAVEGTHPFFVYLPKEITGRECFVNTSDIMSVHKNMLLNDKKDISGFMPLVESKLEYCLQLGIYSKNIENEYEGNA
jgi:hypothetical protein